MVAMESSKSPKRLKTAWFRLAWKEGDMNAAFVALITASKEKGGQKDDWVNRRERRGELSHFAKRKFFNFSTSLKIGGLGSLGPN